MDIPLKEPTSYFDPSRTAIKFAYLTRRTVVYCYDFALQCVLTNEFFSREAVYEQATSRHLQR